MNHHVRGFYVCTWCGQNMTSSSTTNECPVDQATLEQRLADAEALKARRESYKRAEVIEVNRVAQYEDGEYHVLVSPGVELALARRERDIFEKALELSLVYHGKANNYWSKGDWIRKAEKALKDVEQA